MTDLGRELFAKIAPKFVERNVAIEEKYGVRKLGIFFYELLDDLIKSLDDEDS